MCNPAIIIGAATAVMGSLQSIAGYQQQQAQYDYEQQVAEQSYQYQMQAYQASQRAYEQQVAANAAAANRAYQQEQLKLKGEYDKAAQNAQELLIGKLKTQGTVLSSGRTGKSIALLASDAEREYGKDLANLGTNLGYSMQEYNFSTLDIEERARSANAQAAAERMMQPLKPMMGSGPSTTGLVLGIGSSIVSGVTTGMSLSAPSGFGGGSTPKGDTVTNFNKGAAAYGAG
jgi:hypothetical protein